MTEELEAEIKEYDESMVQCIARDYWDTFLELCREVQP